MTPRFPATGIGFTGWEQKSTACQCPWLNKAANQRHDSLSCWVMTSLTDVNMYCFPRKTSAPSLLPFIVSFHWPALDGWNWWTWLSAWFGPNPTDTWKRKWRWSRGVHRRCSRGQTASKGLKFGRSSEISPINFKQNNVFIMLVLERDILLYLSAHGCISFAANKSKLILHSKLFIYLFGHWYRYTLTVCHNPGEHFLLKTTDWEQLSFRQSGPQGRLILLGTRDRSYHHYPQQNSPKLIIYNSDVSEELDIGQCWFFHEDFSKSNICSRLFFFFGLFGFIFLANMQFCGQSCHFIKSSWFLIVFFIFFLLLIILEFFYIINFSVFFIYIIFHKNTKTKY